MRVEKYYKLSVHGLVNAEIAKGALANHILLVNMGVGSITIRRLVFYAVTKIFYYNVSRYRHDVTSVTSHLVGLPTKINNYNDT